MIDLQDALAPIASTLEADGYRLEAREVGDRLLIQVAAGPEACEDCLVPKSMLERMIALRLDTLGVQPVSIDLRYPGE